MIFAVVRERTPLYDHQRPLEEQRDWPAHAAFTDAMADEHVLLLAGPLEGSSNVLMIFNAASAEAIDARLADDPWTRSGLLRTLHIAPWTLRIGALPS